MMAPASYSGGLTVAAAMSAERPADPWYDIVKFDDGTLRVCGKLPPHVREQIEQTHFDTDTRIDRWSVWVPREAGNDS
ncbi:MAG TPA: hypothetical protein VFH48_38400 [Chloroflexota bacterium]|nr:hypothetical protein [Chloroflexota bacterium]